MTVSKGIGENESVRKKEDSKSDSRPAIMGVSSSCLTPLCSAYPMALMHPTPIDIAAIKARMRDTWMAGDFGVIARFAEKLVEEFVERLPLKAGVSVLD